MVYIKMNGDFVSLEDISRMAALPTTTVERFVNKGLQFASMIVSQHASNVSGDEMKLQFLFDLDNMGLSDDVKSALVGKYTTSPNNGDMYVEDIKGVLDLYEVKGKVYESVVARVESEISA